MIPLPRECRGCPLDHAEGFSALEGEGTNGLMIIAEALGRYEEAEGLPLRPDAKAGGVFQKALDFAGLDRAKATLTNTVRCRPPNNELRGMWYYRESVDHCKQYLDLAIAERKPRLLLTLGDVPLQELSTIGGGVSDLRGFVLQSVYGIPMIGTYHPSHIARGAGNLFGAMMHDIRVAYRFAEQGIPPKLKTNYTLDPTLEQACDFLTLARVGVPIAYDIETPSILGLPEPKRWEEKTPIQIQFSARAGTAIVFPWRGEFIEIARLILETEGIKWGWNDRFSDRPCLRGQGFKFGGECHDLMNAWAHLQPGFMSGKDAGTNADKEVPAKLMGLESCVSFYFPQEEVWKGMVDCSCPYDEGTAEREEWFETRVMPKLKWYGARDADMTWRLGERLFRDLKAIGVW